MSLIAGIACPAGYAYNPFACSCLRIIRERKTWDEAKAYCEAAGEYLAVLDSVESINWYKNLRMTNPGMCFQPHLVLYLSLNIDNSNNEFIEQLDEYLALPG